MRCLISVMQAIILSLSLIHIFFTVSVLLPDKPGELAKVSTLMAAEQGNVIKLEPVSYTHLLGADSLDIFQIIMGIEEEFDIEIPTESAEKIVTVQDAVEQIKNALN